MRPLVYDYPEDENTFNILNQYMLGKYLLVAAFIDKDIYLPEGIWIDLFTQKEYQGNRYIQYVVPQGRGGALFAKKGAILCRSYGISSISDEPFDSYTIEIYPSVTENEFVIYEDDGISLEYINGARCETCIKAFKRVDDINISISERKGEFTGKKDNVEYEIIVMNVNKNDVIYINGVFWEYKIVGEDTAVIKINEKELF
jgi:alpha-glucosidase